MGIPSCIAIITTFTASSILSKSQTAAEIASGCPFNATVSSVIIPSVPSLPTNNLLRSYPADDFLALVPVLIILPSAKTISIARTFSRIVP